MTALLIAFAGALPTARADLRADELLLIYNKNLPDSRELATYYAGVRKVPRNRLLGLDLDARNEEIAEPDFERLIRQPIRTALEERQLRGQVRCLVTFIGVPIRIRNRVDTPKQQQLLDENKRAFNTTLSAFENTINKMDAIGRAGVPPVPSPASAPKDYAALVKRYGEVRAAAADRIARKGTAADGAADYQALLHLWQDVEGSASLLQQVQPAGGEAGDAAHQELERMRENVRLANAKLDELMARSAEDPSRTELRRLVREYHGLIGLLRALDYDIARLRSEETLAAVDSELTLLWWTDYPRHRWVLNTLSWRIRTDADVRRQLPPNYWTQPVLMVSRIDASTARVARRMIDDAVAAEPAGLSGTIYLDARGLRNEGMGVYDQNLRDLGTLLWRNTNITTRVDNRAEVYGRGKCPQTMLYCGWYNLRKYVDAFQFVPGAVAFHIASFEAVSLKDPREQGWCKGLLQHGAAATLGPVAEPYLESFPRPKEFFGLLLTGRFTLAECFAYTSPFNSWMQMLLGDPLYRPFGGNPQLKLEQVYDPPQVPPEFLTGAASRPATGPASQPATAPVR